MKKVYIAGPYTKGNVAENVNNAIDAWHVLKAFGYAPFCPHLSHFLQWYRHVVYEDWIEYDLVWLELCDAVFVLPGESAGTVIEVRRAKELCIPVFHNTVDLVNAINAKG